MSDRAEPRARPPAPRAGGPLETPITRRRALLVLVAGTVAAGGGLGVLFAGCGASGPTGPVWAALDVDPATIPVGEPVRVPVTATWDGGAMQVSTWLVRGEDGSLAAYNPLCTHASCEYTWSPEQDAFLCPCHDAAFGLDGSVLKGPPPRPLDRWALRGTGAALEVEVTGRVRPSPSA